MYRQNSEVLTQWVTHKVFPGQASRRATTEDPRSLRPHGCAEVDNKPVSLLSYYHIVLFLINLFKE